MTTKRRHSLTWISYMNTKHFRSLWWQEGVVVGVAGGGSLSTSVTWMWATAELSAADGGPLNWELIIWNEYSKAFCAARWNVQVVMTWRSGLPKDCRLIKLTTKFESQGIQRLCHRLQLISQYYCNSYTTTTTGIHQDERDYSLCTISELN